MKNKKAEKAIKQTKEDLENINKILHNLKELHTANELTDNILKMRGEAAKNNFELNAHSKNFSEFYAATNDSKTVFVSTNASPAALFIFLRSIANELDSKSNQPQGTALKRALKRIKNNPINRIDL